ncbi:MAG: amidase [Actinobacteria bacterium]|nr:amidase [Actinomycetota bacterium]
MTKPWQGDAVGLVEAYRSGERSPLEELEAALDAIERSDLDAFAHLDPDRAHEAAARADVALPFGGIPLAVKELEPVEGWPNTEASLVFADRVADTTSTQMQRLFDAGAVPVGQTTASEFGGLNVSVTKLHGITHNAWQSGRTAGGSSGGSAAAVAGGIVPIASGGDGGGSIRIPAGFNGLVGMKGTAGRIPRGPRTTIAPMTVVVGCLARSVRDVARWYDVANGHDPRDPYSLPRVEGWERDLGALDLAGLRVAIAPDLGVATVRDEVAEIVAEAGAALAAAAGMRVVTETVRLPALDTEWAVGNLAPLRHELGDRWPACEGDLTKEMAFGLRFADDYLSLSVAGRAEAARTAANEAMADIFDRVDLVICATNPDVAFPAHVGANTRVAGRKVGLGNNGALTIPANVVGNPAISIPAGTLDDLPVGMQIIAPHHHDARLLDCALVMERERPWPLVSPLAPC